MPPQTLFRQVQTGRTSSRLDRPITKQLTFKDSRDYRSDDFLDYIDPKFYGGDIPRWTGLLVSNQLRLNNELIALNEPDMGEVLQPDRPQLRGFRVSPQIPNGVYKNNTRALVYYWVDGNQYSVEYYLRSLDSVDPATVEEQVLDGLFSSLLGYTGDLYRSQLANFVTFGISGKVARVIDMLQNEIDDADVFGIWVRGATVVQPISVVTSTTRTPDKGLLESLGLDPETLEPLEKKTSILPILVSGIGIATQQPLLIGGGFVLRYLEGLRK